MPAPRRGHPAQRQSTSPQKVNHKGSSFRKEALSITFLVPYGKYPKDPQAGHIVLQVYARRSKTVQHIGAGINNIKKEGGIRQHNGNIQRTSREHAKATGDGKKQGEHCATRGLLRHPARAPTRPIVANKTRHTAANPRNTPGAPGITREDPLPASRTCRRHGNSYSLPRTTTSETRRNGRASAPSRQPARDTHAYTINTEVARAAIAKTRADCALQQSVDMLKA